MRKLTRRTAVTAAALAVTLSGGAAFAYWLNSGSATATAQTADGTRLTVTNLLTTSPSMMPGDAQLWTFQVNNDGGNNITIDKPNSPVTVTPFSSTAVDPAKPACTQADYAIDSVTLPDTVYAHGAYGGSFSLHFVNSAADQENCKGFKVPISVTVKAA